MTFEGARGVFLQCPNKRTAWVYLDAVLDLLNSTTQDDLPVDTIEEGLIEVRDWLRNASNPAR